MPVKAIKVAAADEMAEEKPGEMRILRRVVPSPVACEIIVRGAEGRTRKGRVLLPPSPARR